MDKQEEGQGGRGTLRMNIVLAAGLALVLAGIFLLVAFATDASRLFAVRPVLLLGAGGVLLFVALAVTRKGFHLFLGLLGGLTGIVTLLTDVHAIPYTMHELWPTIVISCGVALFPAGLYKLRRMRTVYLFPAIMLVGLGCFFLMFSLKVFPFSFAFFVSRWWPLLVIFAGVMLVVLFFVQQLNGKDFPYMEDDSLEEGDED